ncbi:daf-6, partial [Cordylochernes scorpioides]
MGIKCGEKAIEQFFDWLTPKAARHPGWFILLPMLLTCMFLPGLWKVRVDDDLNYLYTPINGRGLVEKAEVERLYHMNFSTDFDQSHLIDIGFFARVLLIPTDKGDVFRSSHFEEVFRIHDTVMDTTITWKGKKWGYKQLCAKSKGECYQEKVLKLRDRLDWINNTEHCVKFPIVIHKTNWSYEFYGMSIGKPTLDNSSCVRAAKAMGIIYHLDSTSPGLREPILLWLDTFLETMRTFSSEYLDIERFTSESISQEIERTTLQGIYFFSLTILTVGSFAVGTCLMMDWVRSKPFIGIIAFIGTVQAFFISSGLLLYLGMGFISMNMSIPFIMAVTGIDAAGIGVDDAFVLLAAWRRTNLRDDVEKRLTTAYKQAGVSITVTSLTNLASFMAGCITPVRAVQIFCLYSSVSVIFTFFFQITFFAGCMTLLARAERRNLHSVTCLPIPPKSKA